MIAKTEQQLRLRHTVVFLDCCHAGNVLGASHLKRIDIDGIVNDLARDESGAVVLTAASGNQLSLESDEWDNGAFTKALVEGMDGSAMKGPSGRITWLALALYASSRVDSLTQGAQTPVMLQPRHRARLPNRRRSVGARSA